MIWFEDGNEIIEIEGSAVKAVMAQAIEVAMLCPYGSTARKPHVRKGAVSLLSSNGADGW